MKKRRFLFAVLAIFVAIISFSLGMEIQRHIAIDEIEDDIIGDLLILQTDIKQVIRSVERDVSPADSDVISLRSNLVNIVNHLTIIRKGAQYPRSFTYLLAFKNEALSDDEVSYCVQQYGEPLCEIPIDREKGLDGFLDSLESSLPES